MGNFSKKPQVELTNALDRGYCAVRFQQGKPVLDHELNLAADLVSPRRLAAAYFGNGVTAGTNGFFISNLQVGTNDFTIAAGRCLVNGLEATLLADTTYRTQPVKTNVAALPAGASNVYLHVFTREVNGAEDPGLLNPGDVNFETSVRDKVEWEVVVSTAALNAPDHFLLAVINTVSSTVNDRRRLNLALSSVRDEMDTARGSAATLTARLGASLSASGTLVANSVGSPQIAALAVTQDKLAANVVALAQVRQGGAFSGTLVIAPATESALTFFTGARQAMLFTSVMVTAGLGTITWREFTAAAQAGTATVFSRGIRVRNENPIGGPTLTVAIQAIEVAQN